MNTIEGLIQKWEQEIAEVKQSYVRPNWIEPISKSDEMYILGISQCLEDLKKLKPRCKPC